MGRKDSIAKMNLPLMKRGMQTNQRKEKGRGIIVKEVVILSKLTLTLKDSDVKMYLENNQEKHQLTTRKRKRK